MTLKELEKRLAALEKTVSELQKQATPTEQEINDDPSKQYPWWRVDAGRFANDPVFDEIVRLGREYRESLHPDRRKKKKQRKKLQKKVVRS